MYPTLFNIGPLGIHTYGLFVALGFIAGFKVLLNYANEIGIPQQKIESFVMWVFIFSIAGARLFYVLISFAEFRYNLFDIFKVWQGGLVFSGGLLAGATAAVVFIKRNRLPLAKLADASVVALSIGQALGRVGCFFAGCCYGKQCDRWFGVKFPENSLAPSGIKLIPSQLVSALILALIFLVLSYYYRRKHTGGQVFALYLVLYSLKRFFVEYLRGDFRGNEIIGFTPTQVISAVLLVGGIYLWKKLSLKKTE